MKGRYALMIALGALGSCVVTCGQRCKGGSLFGEPSHWAYRRENICFRSDLPGATSAFIVWTPVECDGPGRRVPVRDGGGGDAEWRMSGIYATFRFGNLDDDLVPEVLIESCTQWTMECDACEYEGRDGECPIRVFRLRAGEGGPWIEYLGERYE